MKFGDCEKSIHKSQPVNTGYMELDMFAPYAPEFGKREFSFGKYEIILRGIPEDFKVIFYDESKAKLETVGEYVFGRTYHLDGEVYDRMMAAIKEYHITF